MSFVNYQVIDHLCAVSLLSEEGDSVADAEEALLFNEGKEKQARIFLKVRETTEMVQTDGRTSVRTNERIGREARKIGGKGRKGKKVA